MYDFISLLFTSGTSWSERLQRRRRRGPPRLRPTVPHHVEAPHAWERALKKTRSRHAAVARRTATPRVLGSAAHDQAGEYTQVYLDSRTRFSFIEHRAGAPVAAGADQIYPIALESSPNLQKHLRAGHRDLRLAQRIAHRACSPSHRPDQLPAVVLRVVPWPSETPGASPPRVAHGQR